MIRAALVAALLPTSASAATLADCEALIDRVPVQVERVENLAGICIFTGLRFGSAPSTWRADRVTLGGDVDALPDALPRRLSGGLIGLALDPEIPGQPGLAWLMRQQAHPGMSVTFDATADAGVLRINSFRFGADDTNEITLTARVAGVPEVWPVDPIAASAVQIQALDVEVVFDGMFETLFLMSLGALILDTTQDAEPQVAALRETVAAYLADFDETGQQENAQDLQAFVDALPHPRGVLSLGLGGTGLSAVQAGPLLAGTISPDFIARVADAAELDIQWAPDAP